MEDSLFVQHLHEDDEADGWNAIEAADFATSDDDDVISLSDGEGEKKPRQSEITLTSAIHNNTSIMTSSLTSSRVDKVGLNVFQNPESPPEYMFSNDSLLKDDSVGGFIHRLVIKLFRLLHPLMHELKTTYLEHEVKFTCFHHLNELINIYLL